MRLAAVDIGSNTVHALVADVLEDGTLRDVAHYVEMPELGAAVARGGEIGARKRRQAVSALRGVVRHAEEHSFEHLVAGATAAVRKAKDGRQLLEAASKAIGVPVQLIGEQLEADLSFRGVAMRHSARGEWLMADLGGGSLELVPARGREMRAWASLELGSGTFADRFLSDPPRPGERERLREAALPLIRQAPECDPERLVATGGTASNLPLVLSAARPPEVLDQQALLAAEERLDSSPAAAAARRFRLPAARIKALRGGVEILLLLIDWYGLHHVHVSHEGLRQGMLLAYLDRGDAWADEAARSAS
jgi:exopolyphosphatase/guanosine-5'-triphosphate,3'-diphosphate pyrophosphatase